jgi:hypothetical protein
MLTHDQKINHCRRAERTIKALERMGLVYDLGGARGSSEHNGINPPSGSGLPWTDCSGFVLYIMSILGIKAKHPAGWTGTLVEEGEVGASPYFTIYLKEPEQREGHVIIRLRKRPRWWHLGKPKHRWAECGGNDNPHPDDGPTFWTPSKERIAEFPYQRHFREF